MAVCSHKWCDCLPNDFSILLKFKSVKKILFICCFLSFNISHAQCAMCKAVVESGNESVAEGLNTGIVYLMIFPYLLVGALLYFIIKSKKNPKI